MMDVLEALYGFAMWTVKAAVAMAAVAAIIAVPVYLLSWTWHSLVRGDRRCAQCGAWFGARPGEDADLTRCRGCRGGVSHAVGQPGWQRPSSG